MLILASASSRREEILKNASYDFLIIKSDFDETSINATKKNLAKVLSYNKANEVYNKLNDKKNVVIGADTVVLFKNRIYGKPKSFEEAFLTLKTLNNKTHKVITGVTIISSNKIKSFKVTSKVKFKNLTDKEIKDYIYLEKPYDKAGAYGIQNQNTPVLTYYGDYYNIMGLPINKLKKELKKFNILPK